MSGRSFKPPSYTQAHWGEKGYFQRKPMWIPDPKSSPIIVLGTLAEITYRTVKGGDGGELTDYHHDFGRPYPLLCYSSTGLIIAGGRYTVSSRGIVG